MRIDCHVHSKFSKRPDGTHLCPLQSTRRELVARGIRADKIALYPRGVDVHRFTPEKPNGFYEQRCGVQADVKLLYVGRVSKEKNLDIRAEAYDRVRVQHPRTHLVVVGEGPYLEDMRRQLRRHPCTFTGTLTGDDLVKAYAAADLFVFPSTTDTFGNVILEAQACGLPVVVTDQGGPKENMRPDKTGLVVPGNDSAALAAALHRLLASRSMRSAMGQEARRFMTARSFEAAFLETWESYRTIKERIMNRLNPCHQCHRRDKDKNNSQWRVCNKRMAYLRRLACELEFSAAVAVDHGYPLHLPARRS
jgi:glycosyltransferase involved in cell wall biosynthesis